MSREKIQFFTDLIVWQEGHKLVSMVYDVTKSFPEEEKFGLISQMRRCVISVTSNIAEGFGRRGYKEKLQFYYVSLGSITELKSQLLVAKDVDYISEKDFSDVMHQVNSTHKLLNLFISKTKNIFKIIIP